MAIDLSNILKRSVVLAGHKTSVSLEDEFWDRLKIFATRDRRSVRSMIEEIDQHRGRHNLSSAIRLYVLRRCEENQKSE